MSMNNFLFMIFGGYVLYGLSGNLLNSVWPEVANDISAEVALLGIVATFCNLASGITSALVHRIRRHLGTNRTISIGLLCMTICLIMFCFSTNIVTIGIAFVILGIGNAIVDIASNSYIVKAYDAKVGSMLHACWGIGSAVGPIIMVFAMTFLKSYRLGFAIGAGFNILVILILRFMKRNWEAHKGELSEELVKLHSVSETEKTSLIKFSDVIKIKLVPVVMICFFFANGFNGLINTWIATIFVTQRNISVVEGANTATVFFATLTITRIILGFIAGNSKTKTVIIRGIIISLLGVAMMFVQEKNIMFIYANAILLGIGIAPLIPFLIHYLKELFGSDIIGAIISYCAVFSMTGVAATSLVATFIVRTFGVGVIQWFIILIVIVLLVLYLYIVGKVENKKSEG